MNFDINSLDIPLLGIKTQPCSVCNKQVNKVYKKTYESYKNKDNKNVIKTIMLCSKKCLEEYVKNKVF